MKAGVVGTIAMEMYGGDARVFKDLSVVAFG